MTKFFLGLSVGLSATLVGFGLWQRSVDLLWSGAVTFVAGMFLIGLFHVRDH